MADVPQAVVCRRYRAYGLAFESDIELPELVAIPPDGAVPEVVVRAQRVPPTLEAPVQEGVCYQARAGELLAWLPGLARFHVTSGAVAIEAGPATPASAIRSLLLSSPMAALLLLRGLLPLHASAVATPKGAAVFVGPACTGKSALAAEMRRGGFGLLADDITALRLGPDMFPVALPSYPWLRLWPDLLKQEDIAARGAEIRPGLGKRFVSCAGGFPSEPAPIAAIYELDPGQPRAGEAWLSRLRGADAVAALGEAVYRPAFVRGLRLEREVFTQVAALAQSVRVCRLFLAGGGAGLAEAATRAREDLGL